jgi:hypothetical protein
MAKKRAGNQTASLTPDQKKLGIDLKYLTFDESYNFASNLTLIRGLLAKLWGFKVPGVS